MPPTTVTVVYVGPFDEVELANGTVLAYGGEADVDVELAGTAPTGEPDSDDYDPGCGLLAQPTNWQPATAAPAPKEPTQ